MTNTIADDTPMPQLMAELLPLFRKRTSGAAALTYPRTAGGTAQPLASP
jgi:hypothetical protein